MRAVSFTRHGAFPVGQQHGALPVFSEMRLIATGRKFGLDVSRAVAALSKLRTEHDRRNDGTVPVKSRLNVQCDTRTVNNRQAAVSAKLTKSVCAFALQAQYDRHRG